jgi:hypothetical protein
VPSFVVQVAASRNAKRIIRFRPRISASDPLYGWDTFSAKKVIFVMIRHKKESDFRWLYMSDLA